MNLLNPKNLLFSVAVLLFFSAFVAAQDDRDEIIKIDTDLATFDVTVTDADGNPARGLTAKDFRIFEDGEERDVEFFEQAQKANGARPIAVVFALDVSGSVTPEEIEKLRAATNVFIDRLADKTATFALVSFGMNVKRLQDFTNDKKKIGRAFERLLREESGLSTHAYDAIDDAVRLLDRKVPRAKGQFPVKKSVIVVTDGFPVGDAISPATVIERAQAAEVSIFTVTLPSFTKVSLSKNRAPLPTPLDVSGLAEKTGGKSVYATDKDFEPLFRSLAEDVTASYLLAFYPAEEKRRDGRFHIVKIEARTSGYTVRQNRTGYQAK